MYMCASMLRVPTAWLDLVSFLARNSFFVKEFEPDLAELRMYVGFCVCMSICEFACARTCLCVFHNTGLYICA